MRTLPCILCLASAGLLSACASPERLPNAQYTLGTHQTLILPPQPKDGRLTLTYEGVDDSRCPQNARCMWPGELAYRFTLRINNVAQGFWLVPGKPGYTSPALRGARVELDPSFVSRMRGMTGNAPASYPVVLNMYGS